MPLLIAEDDTALVGPSAPCLARQDYAVTIIGRVEQDLIEMLCLGPQQEGLDTLLPGLDGRQGCLPSRVEKARCSRS
ncbi:hypothetical protein [Pseudomonas sp. Marseille-Q7302]